MNRFFWHLKENVQSIQIKRAFLISKDKKRCPHLYKSWSIVLNCKNERCMLSLSSSLPPFLKKSIKKTTRPTNSWILRKEQKEQRPPWPLSSPQPHSRRGHSSIHRVLDKNSVDPRILQALFSDTQGLMINTTPIFTLKRKQGFKHMAHIGGFTVLSIVLAPPCHGNSAIQGRRGSTFSPHCFSSASTHPSPLVFKCVLCAASSILQLR